MARAGFGGGQGCCPAQHSRACSTCSPRHTPGLWRIPLEDSFGGCDTAGLGTPNPAQGHLEQPHSPGLSLSWSCIPGLPPGSRCGVSPTARPVQRGFVASSCSMGQDWPCPCHIHGCRWGELWPLALGFAFKPPCPLCRAAWGAKWAFTRAFTRAFTGAAGEGEVPKLTGNTWTSLKNKKKPNKTNIFASTAKPTSNFQPQSIFPWWEQIILGSWGGDSWHPHHEP